MNTNNIGVAKIIKTISKPGQRNKYIVFLDPPMEWVALNVDQDIQKETLPTEDTLNYSSFVLAEERGMSFLFIPCDENGTKKASLINMAGTGTTVESALESLGYEVLS